MATARTDPMLSDSAATEVLPVMAMRAAPRRPGPLAGIRNQSARVAGAWARSHRAAGSGREFQRGRAWLVATLCGLLGLSLVLAALAVTQSLRPAPPPLVNMAPAPAPTTQAAPPPPAPTHEAAQPRQATPKPRSDSDGDGDGGQSGDGDDVAGPGWAGSSPGWGNSGPSWGSPGSDMARDMMRYRMSHGYPPHHW